MCSQTCPCSCGCWETGLLEDVRNLRTVSRWEWHSLVFSGFYVCWRMIWPWWDAVAVLQSLTRRCHCDHPSPVLAQNAKFKRRHNNPCDRMRHQEKTRTNLQILTFSSQLTVLPSIRVLSLQIDLVYCKKLIVTWEPQTMAEAVCLFTHSKSDQRKTGCEWGQGERISGKESNK